MSLEYTRAYYAANREKMAAKSRAWRARYPDKVKAYSQSERSKEAGRRYYAANRDKVLARVKLYRDTNPEYRHRKQELERGLRSSNVYRRLVWKLLLQRDGDICQLCRFPIAPGQESIDHIVPLSLGGAHEAENVRLLHRTCNFRRAKGRYSTLFQTLTTATTES